MNEKEAFAARLRQAMTEAGHEVRPAALEKLFNSRYWGRSVTFQAVSRWLNGRSIPTQEKLLVLADLLAVDPQALRYGKEAVRRIGEKRARWDAGLAPEDREMVDTLLRLPVAQKRIVREVIRAFARGEETD
jgi:transcriptional regulator with XRE-family HTH domain